MDVTRAITDGVPDPEVAQALVDAYSYFGPEELGCPNSKTVHVSGLYIVRLAHAGKRTGAVVSDETASANAVFLPFLPVVDRLIDRHLLARVGSRTDTPLGNYQAFRLRDETCVLVLRREHSKPYVDLEPATTEEVVNLAIERRAFPFVESRTIDGTFTRYEIGFETDFASPSATIYFNAATATAGRSRAATATRRPVRCPDLEGLDKLAATFRAREKRR